jgi:hypothetical protein
LSLGYLYQTLQIPSLDTVDPLGPRAYPYLVFAGFIISAIWLSLELFQKRKYAQVIDQETTEEADNLQKKHGFMLVAVVAWTGLYYTLIVPVGFTISSFVFLAVLTNVFNPGKWIVNTVTSLGFVVGLYFLFTSVLGVPLSKGVLGI